MPLSDVFKAIQNDAEDMSFKVDLKQIDKEIYLLTLSEIGREPQVYQVKTLQDVLSKIETYMNGGK